MHCDDGDTYLPETDYTIKNCRHWGATHLKFSNGRLATLGATERATVAGKLRNGEYRDLVYRWIVKEPSQYPAGATAGQTISRDQYKHKSKDGFRPIRPEMIEELLARGMAFEFVDDYDHIPPELHRVWNELHLKNEDRLADHYFFRGRRYAPRSKPYNGPKPDPHYRGPARDSAQNVPITRRWRRIVTALLAMTIKNGCTEAEADTAKRILDSYLSAKAA